MSLAKKGRVNISIDISTYEKLLELKQKTGKSFTKIISELVEKA